MIKKLLLASPFMVLLLIVVIGVLNLNYHNKNNLIEGKIMAGERILIPEFSLPDLYDQKKMLSNQDLKGQYTIINVFASWCISCKTEHNLLMKISRDNENLSSINEMVNKIKIYGIAWRDIEKNTKDYLEKNGNPYSRVMVDGKGIFSKILPVSGTPETFIVNPQGQIIYYQKGVIDDKFINFIYSIN